MFEKYISIFIHNLWIAKMAVGIDALNDDFRDKVANLIKTMRALGIVMRPYTAVRTVEEQAILWRQSRSAEEVQTAIERLRDGGAPFLAEALQSVGPRHGKHVTNALPGLSWHQWGEAVDCFWAVNGVAEWSASRIIDGVNGYQVYAEMAKQAGLTAGGFWRSLKDWPHVQLRAAGSPVLSGYNLAEIDAEMQKRFA
ncbi:M15 family metallopeptidase [Agrobacterium pusense]|uniref:M15 family metallopeptidase n=1 Tax=Agrobacterium pusense TaxID=648995 RepID=UPI003FD4476D